MVCHVDFSVEAIYLSSTPLSDSGGLYKSCDVSTFVVNKF